MKAGKVTILTEEEIKQSFENFLSTKFNCNIKLSVEFETSDDGDTSYIEVQLLNEEELSDEVTDEINEYDTYPEFGHNLIEELFPDHTEYFIHSNQLYIIF